MARPFFLKNSPERHTLEFELRIKNRKNKEKSIRDRRTLMQDINFDSWFH